MGTPVVTVAAGGLPVVETTSGTPVTEATPQYGVAVTKVAALGLPVTFDAAALATFTPASIVGGVTLSNGNLTATHTGGVATGGVVGPYKNSGKYYFEIRTTIVASSDCLGIMGTSGIISADVNDTKSVGVLLGAASDLYANGVDTTKNFLNRAANDVWGVAVDLSARLIWVRRNGGNWNMDAAANPATGVNGVSFTTNSYAPWIRFPSPANGEVFTANFGALAYANAAPSGFGNWTA